MQSSLHTVHSAMITAPCAPSAVHGHRHLCCAACGHTVADAAHAFTSDTFRDTPRLDLPDCDCYALDAACLLHFSWRKASLYNFSWRVCPSSAARVSPCQSTALFVAPPGTEC